MLPILYSANEINFNSNGLGVLRDCISCEVTEERNGLFEIELVYPVGGWLYDQIKGESIIKTKADNTSKEAQLFRVYKIERDIDDTITVNAEHISYRLKDNFIEHMKYTGSIQSIMENFKNYCAFPLNQFEFYSEYAGIFNVDYSCRNILNILIGSEEDSLLNMVDSNATVFRDNFKFRIDKKETNNNVLIAYRKNMTGFKCEEDWSNSCTMIYPYIDVSVDDTDEDGNKINASKRITIKDKYIISKNADKHAGHKIIPVDFKDYFGEGEEITQESLELKALNYFKDTKADMPTLNYSIDLVELSKTEEYKNAGLTENICCNDNVIVRHELYNLDTTIKIIKTVYDSLAEEYETIELGEIQEDIQSMFGKVESKIDRTDKTVNEITAKLTNNYSSWLEEIYSTIGALKSDRENTKIKDYSIQYYLSDSSLTTNGGEWLDTAPKWDNDKYMWQRIKITYDDDSVRYWNETQLQKSLLKSGIPYKELSTGRTAYLHYAFSEFPDGKNMDSSIKEDGYIGLLADWNIQSSEDYRDYTWSKLINPKGKDYLGKTVLHSDDMVHTPVTMHIKYSSDGEKFTDVPKIKFEELKKNDETGEYEWVEEEVDGRKIKEGETFASNWGYYVNATWGTVQDSRNFDDYTWNNGDSSEIVVSNIDVEYYLSDSKTEPTGGEWTTTKPTWTDNKYLFVRNKLNYNDNGYSYSNLYGDSSWEYKVPILDNIKSKLADITIAIKDWEGDVNSVNKLNTAKDGFKHSIVDGIWDKKILDRLNTLIDKIFDYVDKSIKDVVTHKVMQKAIDVVSNAITGNDGGYVRLNPPENPSEILIMDNEDINKAQTIWRWNKSGLGCSRTGYNGEYIGFTKDGKIVMNEATFNKADINFLRTQVIESINTNSNYFKISTDGATFGDMSTGEYTKIGQHGFEHVDSTGSKPYLYITKVQQYQLYYPKGNTGYVTHYCKFNNTIKASLNGKVPQVFLCNTRYGESSAVANGTAEIESIDAEGFTVKFQVWQYDPKGYISGSDVSIYWDVKNGGYFDFDALILA